MKTFGPKFAIMRTLIILIGVLAAPGITNGACVVPDNNTGTATLPPIGCEYGSAEEVFMITDGLPDGTTIEMEGILMDFICCGSSCTDCTLALSGSECETAGGSLGGNGHCFEASLDLTVTGTGTLEGFSRHLVVPIKAEVHTAPRTPGEPIQDFNTVVYYLRGQLYGDPDFCTFIIRAGTDFNLPSPGHTTLTELPSGDFAVDSFFDITYQIEFEGCPGSQLEDYDGITTETIRIGTSYMECAAKEDGSGCRDVNCPEQGSECQPVCVNYDPNSGVVTVLDCDCRDPNECHVDLGLGCVVADNNTGTATLPPIGCEFTSPNDVFKIINGLPAGTTIEMEGIWMDFVCCANSCSNCSLAIPSGECEMAGGTLGGHGDCFDSTLDLTVTGTGGLEGFNRHLAVPVFAEVHTGPRTPGDPIQTFPADLYRFQGQLFGDPDFCTFIVRGGTDLGLPSPGQTTLRRLTSGDFAVDSFFDITYQIEFEGCPGSILEDYDGTTTATIRMRTGGPLGCVGDCEVWDFCMEKVTNNPDGTIDIRCNCVPDADLNRDKIVDFKDLAILADQWLTTRP